jgi:hypothetical protein
MFHLVVLSNTFLAKTAKRMLAKKRKEFIISLADFPGPPFLAMPPLSKLSPQSIASDVAGIENNCSKPFIAQLAAFDASQSIQAFAGLNFSL